MKYLLHTTLILTLRYNAGATVNVGIDPSKVIITKLKIDKDRRCVAALAYGAVPHGMNCQLFPPFPDRF
jgi:large subunit ribosomal protein L26e